MKRIIILLITISLFACNHKNKQDIKQQNQDISIEDTQSTNNNTYTTDNQIDTNIADTINNTQNEQKNCPIFKNYEIPSPLEFKYAVNQTTPDYNLLFALSEKDKMNDTYTKSLALGIYSADLVYIVFYENTNLLSQYFKTTLILADELGLSSAFTQKDFDNLQNTENQQEKEEIIDKAIQNACIQLNDSKAFDQLPFVIYGAWIESIYLLSATLINNPQAPEELYKQLSSQKNVIKNMQNFYNNALINTDDFNINLNIQNILNELETIDKTFQSSYKSSDYILSKDEIEKIYKQISSTRNNLMQKTETKLEMQMSHRPTE